MTTPRSNHLVLCTKLHFPLKNFLQSSAPPIYPCPTLTRLLIFNPTATPPPSPHSLHIEKAHAFLSHPSNLSHDRVIYLYSQLLLQAYQLALLARIPLNLIIALPYARSSH